MKVRDEFKNLTNYFMIVCLVMGNHQNREISSEIKNKKFWYYSTNSNNILFRVMKYIHYDSAKNDLITCLFKVTEWNITWNGWKKKKKTENRE